MKAWCARIGVGLIVLLALMVAAAVVLWREGRIERWARGEMIRRVELATGARIELGGFRLHLEPLSVELDQLTLHGRETAGEPPFVRVDRVNVEVTARELLHRHVELASVRIVRPAVYIRIDRSGNSNVPVPPVRRPSTPWNQQIFQVAIDHLRVDDGVIAYNDRRIPLAAEGGRFTFRMDYSSAALGRDFYRGSAAWQGMRIVAEHWVPIPASWSAQFTLGRRGGSLDRFQLALAHSAIEGRVDWPDYTHPAADFRYRVRLDLADVRTLLRKPHSPLGLIESTGDLRYAPGAWRLAGYYSARNIAMGYKWYHEAGMSSRGTLQFDPRGLTIPDFQAWAMGGIFTGRVRMDGRSLAFTADTRSSRVSLAKLLAAVQNTDFPVQTLHWDAGVEVDSLTTWHADFQHMASQGRMIWAPLPVTPPGEMPASANIEFLYRMDRAAADAQGEIKTPHTDLRFNGTIGDVDSDMAINLLTNDLSDWNEMIDYLRGPQSPHVPIRGRATWQGRVTGHVGKPLFSGHTHAWDAGYGALHWDEIEGNVSYSPAELTLDSVRVGRGRSLATISLHLDLTGWDFEPNNRWSFSARLAGADTDDLQGLAGTHYPARGLLGGQFRGGGTRAESQMSGNFLLQDFATEGLRFARVSGRMEFDSRQVRLTGVRASFGSGAFGGDFTYHRGTEQVEFDLFGTQLPVQEIKRLQTPSLPLAGRADFRLTGGGSYRSPHVEGTVSVSSLRAGGELIGDLNGRLRSDGRQLEVALTSKLAKGRLAGNLQVTMGGGYPVQGQFSATEIDLDPFIVAGLHLRALTGHSRVDGRFQLAGEMRRPNTLTVAADVSRVDFSFENVNLQNNGPLRLSYREGEVRIEQAALQGAESNFQLSGVVRFRQNQPLALHVAGGLNLALAEAFVPGLRSQGAAQMDAEIVGTFSRPQINGRAHLENASLNYSDIPIGLSSASGDVIFSSDHLSFTDLRAQAGGGSLVLAGTVNFAGGAAQAQYDLGIAATQVRVRYPEGMSWLLDADSRLAGNVSSATLSGQITIDRLFFTNGLDVAAALLAPRQPVPATEGGSSFLRNLQLDFNVTSGPGSQLTWTGTYINLDAGLRVRGTWNRPSVLGHVHLLSGQVNVRGDKYRLTRGDLNFANPLLLDPEMNVEATTTIQQYQVTVDLTGQASALRLSYRSDPPLPESDVIALLALGYTGEESQLRTAGQPTNFGASALLSQAISSEVGGRIERLFGISRFRIDPELAGTGTESNAAARITVEQQVTPNLTITYSANATSNSEQVIQIEYAVSRDISIVALRDINGTFGLDIEFKKHFK
ncbi:MAG TPA: translocation/assembly module TamB domain-containing protein [Candidatus Acidoferrales bacterium]|nr:translocation/assembly module TamB domain-containing protein [Candidatus Acidoferrales bacterium]